MLTAHQISQITKEVVLGLEPSLKTAEALEMRKRIEENVAQMRKDGIAVDIPYDFD